MKSKLKYLFYGIIILYFSNNCEIEAFFQKGNSNTYFTAPILLNQNFTSERDSYYLQKEAVKTEVEKGRVNVRVLIDSKLVLKNI